MLLVGICAALIGAGAVLAVLFATGTIRRSTSRPTAAQTLRLYDRGVADVVQGAFGSVAAVEALTPDARQEGSGVIVGREGLVLTNNHVVKGARALTVTLPVQTAQVPPGADVVARPPPGSSAGATIIRVPGSLVASAPDRDLALIRVPVGGLRPIPLAAATNVRLGQKVIAIGFSLSLSGGPSVSSGIVSATNRSVRSTDGHVYGPLIQTDAAINRGNSGGPLIDTAGRLVGIDSLAEAGGVAEDIGFATPADRALELIRQARR